MNDNNFLNFEGIEPVKKPVHRFTSSEVKAMWADPIKREELKQKISAGRAAGKRKYHGLSYSNGYNAGLKAGAAKAVSTNTTEQTRTAPKANIVAFIDKKEIAAASYNIVGKTLTVVFK